MEYSRTNINRLNIVDQIIKKVEKLNKRAKKLGVSELKTFVDVEDRMIYIKVPRKKEVIDRENGIKLEIL